MTDTEMIETVRVLVDNDVDATDAVLSVYISAARDRVMNRLYPFGCSDSDEVPEQYHMLLCELTARIFLRRGAEGEGTHNEDGVSRVYASVDDIDILNRIVPFASLG